MKKIILMLFLAFFTATGIGFAQQKKVAAEVLYFKASQSGSKAKTSNALEARVRAIVEKNWPDGKVVFRQVRLDDPLNRDLVKQYNAQSQSLVIVVTKKDVETSTNISALLRDFVMKNDTAKFEAELTGLIREAIK